MAVLLDCEPVISFDISRPGLLATVVIEAGTRAAGGIDYPVVVALWSPDATFMTNPYVAGIQFEYGIAGGTTGITRSAVQGKEMLSWTSGDVVGGAYAVRYRAVGSAKEVYGPWSDPQIVEFTSPTFGELATADQVDWATQVTGVNRPADLATRSRVFRSPATSPPVGPTINDIWIVLDGTGVQIAVAAWNGSNWIVASDMTAFNIASGITGQGPGATAPGDNVLNSALYGSMVNRLSLTNFDAGTRGWAQVQGTGLANSLVTGVSGRVPFIRLAVAFTGAGQEASLSSNQGIYRAFCTPGERLVIRSGIEAVGSNVGNLVFNVMFWDAASNYIGGGQYTPNRSGPQGFGTIVSGFFTVPAGAVTCTLEHYIFSTGPGSASITIIQPMIAGANPTQVLIPPYVAGPQGVPGADPTGDNIAAGFTGQGWGATATELQAANARMGIGVNAVVNSGFEKGMFGWGEGPQAATRLFNLSGYSGLNNVAYVNYSGTLNPGQVIFGLRNHPIASYATDIKVYGLPVQAGDRVYASVYLACHNCDSELVVAFWNETDFQTQIFPGGRAYGGQNGDFNNFDRVGGFVTVPAGITRVTIFTRMRGNGGSNCYMFFTAAMVCRVPSVQTIEPAYHAGPINPPNSINDPSGSGVTINPALPLSGGGDPSSQINVASAQVTFSAGQVFPLPSSTISGLAPNTIYAVFRDLQTATYTAVASGMTEYLVSSGRYLFLGYQKTAQNSGGSYSPPPPRLPGIGGGYGDNAYYVEP